MTSATTILTIMAMLWHSIVGCCAHHEHVSTSQIAVEACSGISSGHVCKHFSSSNSAQTEHENSQVPPDDCSDADCVFSLSSVDGGIELSKSVEMLPSFNVWLGWSCDAHLGIGQRKSWFDLSATGKITSSLPAFIRFRSLLL